MRLPFINKEFYQWILQRVILQNKKHFLRSYIIYNV